MTKERHIYYVEKALEEELVRYEGEDNSLARQIIFEKVSEYVDALRYCDVSYRTAKSASAALCEMLQARIPKEIEKNRYTGDPDDIDWDNLMISVKASKQNWGLVKAQESILRIFYNTDEMEEEADVAVCRFQEAMDLLEKNGIDINKISRSSQEDETIEVLDDIMIDGFRCSIKNITDLEEIMGLQPDFDEVMGRSFTE